MQRHVTSVFSQYDTIENNSANSKQLQYWLKQISNPVSAPSLGGFQWTFMTNQSSSFQRPSNFNGSQPVLDEMSFGKTVNSSVDRDKQNNSLVSNANKNQFTQSKSKSYVNAMIALQKKVKTLEDQNIFMRKNMAKFNQEKNRSMSDSMATQQQLKTKLKMMQPRVAKMEQLIQQNKVLRVSREQKSRKIKQLQKQCKELTKNLQLQSSKLESIQNTSAQQLMEIGTKNNKLKQLQNELQVQYNKNRNLEQMKQKSTVSILQKYNRSVELTQQLEKQNGKLKNEINYLKNKFQEDVKNIHDSHQQQIKKCQIQFQKLKESVGLKDSLIVQKKREADYFREAYEKKDEQFMELIRSHHKLIEQQKSQVSKLQQENRVSPKRGKQDNKQTERNMQPKQRQKENEIKKQVQRLKLKQQPKSTIGLQVNQNYQVVASKESSIVRLPQTIIPTSHQRGSFDGFDSCEECEDEFDESAIPIAIETKSVGKPAKKNKNQRKQVLSSESRKAESKVHKNSGQKNTRTALVSPKQHKKIERKKKITEQQEGSFTMKSCQGPKTQPMHRITFEDNLGQSRHKEQKLNQVTNSYYYSAQQYPPLPHCSQGKHEDIQDFNYRNTSNQSLEQGLVIQLQKQLLQLYEQQQNLILASNEEMVSQAERSQYVGRLKQINEHLRIKNQKICELKSRI